MFFYHIISIDTDNVSPVLLRVDLDAGPALVDGKVAVDVESEAGLVDGVVGEGQETEHPGREIVRAVEWDCSAHLWVIVDVPRSALEEVLGALHVAQLGHQVGVGGGGGLVCGGHGHWVAGEVGLEKHVIE